MESTLLDETDAHNSKLYSTVDAFDAGFINNIITDPIRKDTNNEIDIEKLQRERNNDIQMHADSSNQNM
jgi:hypothetical protein